VIKSGFFNLEKLQIKKIEIQPPQQSVPTEKDWYEGQRECPICKGTIIYRWERGKGFTIYECSTNDCLPWPVGGAKKRREAGLSSTVPTRYEKESV